MLYKITNLKKIKKNYLIIVDKDDFIIDSYFYECFLPYVGKEIKKEDMILLESFSIVNPFITRLYKKVFQNAISTYDFKEKLRIKKIDDDTINIVTKYLKDEGLLNDHKFVDNLKELYSKAKGKKAFKAMLIKNHIHEKIIDEYLFEYEDNLEYALKYANSYIKNKSCSTSMKKYKLKVQLSNKGYENKTIEYVLDNIKFGDDSAALYKDISKIYQKYDEKKILAKMLSKGYNYSNIKETLEKVRLDYEN